MDYSNCMLIIFLLFFSVWSHDVNCQTSIFTVVESGAISDAQTDTKQVYIYIGGFNSLIVFGSTTKPNGNYILINK